MTELDPVWEKVLRLSAEIGRDYRVLADGDVVRRDPFQIDEGVTPSQRVQLLSLSRARDESTR